MGKIVFVDDDFLILKAISMTFQQNGIEAFCTDSGLKALSEILKTKPDIVFLDLNLKDLNGIEILRLIRANPDMASSKIYILTGSSDKNLLNKAMSLGAVGILSKPYTPKDVMNVIEGCGYGSV